MVTITVSAGAPAMDIEPGAYEVTLLSIEGPRTIYPQSGPNAGKEVEVLDWSFALESDQVITGTTSTASGPKSKLYSWLTALLGQPPQVGSVFEPGQLAGRMAIATIEMQDSGWPRIANLSALPRRRAPEPVPQPAAQPRPAARPVAQPARPVAPAALGEADDLPF